MRDDGLFLFSAFSAFFAVRQSIIGTRGLFGRPIAESCRVQLRNRKKEQGVAIAVGFCYFNGFGQLQRRFWG
jgi:hypothetical protein